MEGTFCIARYFAIDPARWINSKYPGKVPACGTISLIERSTTPVITGFPREPSVTTGSNQIPVRRQTAAEQTNEKCSREGASVTKRAKPTNPSINMGGVKILETPGKRRETGCSEPPKEFIGGPCAKKPASKSEIADQIGLHLRSVYDDVLAQPVPGRFLELLRQLESASSSRLSKDGM
jgi:hypothetical protein